MFYIYYCLAPGPVRRSTIMILKLLAMSVLKVELVENGLVIRYEPGN